MPRRQEPAQPDTPGALLRKLRQDKGFRTRELAARLGISASHIRSIENSHRALTPELRARICDVLGVELDDLPSAREIPFEHMAAAS